MLHARMEEHKRDGRESQNTLHDLTKYAETFPQEVQLYT